MFFNNVLAEVIGISVLYFFDSYTLRESDGLFNCYYGRQRLFPTHTCARSLKNECFIRDVKQELESVGQKPEFTKYSFCTNGSHFAGEAGIKTFGFGPSRENLAHTDDEYVDLFELEKACEGYEAIMHALAK